MRKHVFALVDCASFYASCERVFNPKIVHLVVQVERRWVTLSAAGLAVEKSLAVQLGCRSLGGIEPAHAI